MSTYKFQEIHKILPKMGIIWENTYSMTQSPETFLIFSFSSFFLQPLYLSKVREINTIVGHYEGQNQKYTI